MAESALGIDIGGTGMKAAPVDRSTGALLAERFRIPTPKPSKPGPMADIVRQLAEHFSWQGPIGCTYPGVVKNGVVHTAANVHESWIGTDADAHFSEATGCEVHMLNDADAAGIAEMHFGAGVDQRGVVVMVTLGTGIGTAVFTDGTLVPNTELGHIELRGKDAEERAAASARTRKNLSWADWAKGVEEYLRTLERLLWPDLFILGGGVTKTPDKFVPLLQTDTPLVVATHINNAGIVGAALSAPD